VASTYEVNGIPRDMGAALALFERSPFDFERWASPGSTRSQR